MVPECEICHSSQIASQRIRDGLTYVICSNCRHALLETKGASLEDSFSAAQDKYFGVDTLLAYSAIDPFEEEMMGQRRELFCCFVKSPADVLEVGPGAGTFMRWAIQIGHRVTTIEESCVLGEALRASADAVVHVGIFENVRLPDASQDVFCSFHVIEHTPVPRDHLLHAARIIRPGGFAFIATPNGTSWQQRMFRTLSPNFDSAHLRVFSEHSLARLARETGWHVVRMETPEYSGGWLRVLSKFIRRVRNEDEEVTAGAYSARLSQRSRMFLKVFGLISWPLRRLQARLHGGNEIFAVLRRVE